MAAAVLLRPSMRNSFNLLLLTLALVDSLYLLFGIMEAVSPMEAGQAVMKDALAMPARERRVIVRVECSK